MHIVTNSGVGIDMWGGAASAAGRPSLPTWAQPLVGVAAVLAVSELVARTGAIASLPPATLVVARLWAEVREPAFWAAVGDTLQGWAVGLAVAIVVAIPLGLAIGLNELLFRATRPVIEFLRPVPSVALLPVAILLYGIGLPSKVFLAAIGAFWQLLILSVYGARDLDPVHREVARSYRIGRLRRFAWVTLPGAVRYLATGLRIASTVALLLSVTAELLIGAPGLGREMNLARQGGAVDLTYALIVAAGLLGWGLNLVFVRFERSVLRWHPSQREARP
jgi:ABC-type nitrate/sulfonate/bicarbonate transport system permease component